MHRREMIKAAAVLGSAAVLASDGLADDEPKGHPFNLGYGPHPGMFKHSAGADIIDQIKFCADQGFTAFEYNAVPKETPAMQEKIGKTLADLGMQMGVFVAYGSFDRPTFARPQELPGPEGEQKVIEAYRQADSFS